MLRVRPPHGTTSYTRTGSAADRIAPSTPVQLNEADRLQRLFLGLSHRYEEHCRRSGTAWPAALCAAGSRFRRDRSLAALISFADRLDELDVPLREAP